jgi:predicted nucleic acid-binding protein
MTTLVDSNILLDIVTSDPDWLVWSSTVLQDCLHSGELVLNAIVYSEVSGAFGRIEEVDAFLDEKFYRREDVPWAAAYLAGQVFRQYRRQGGTKTAPLPDFFIGAHAAICGYRLLTRDRSYFKAYFPNLRVLSPANFP